MYLQSIKCTRIIVSIWNNILPEIQVKRKEKERREKKGRKYNTGLEREREREFPTSAWKIFDTRRYIKIAFAFLSRALIEAWQPFCMTLLIARRHWMTRCSPVEEGWFIVDGIENRVDSTEKSCRSTDVPRIRPINRASNPARSKRKAIYILFSPSFRCWQPRETNFLPFPANRSGILPVYRYPTTNVDHRFQRDYWLSNGIVTSMRLEIGFLIISMIAKDVLTIWFFPFS